MSRLVPYVVTIAVSALLASGPRPVSAADLPADVTADLDRAVAPGSAAPCPDEALYSLTRPDPAGRPTVVGLAIFFRDIALLSDVDQTLDADVYVTARWRDARLADPGRGEASADCPVPTGRLWMPTLEPESLRSRQVFYPDRFFVDGRGTVTVLRRLWLKTSYPLNFRDFPIDSHRWVFTLWPVFSRADELIFYPLKRQILLNDHFSIQGWHVEAARVEASTAPRMAQAGTFARFDIELGLTRDWSFHVWRLGVPLVLIVLMAYGVYFIPPTAVPQQIGLGTTAMLTLIAYMLTLGSTLPRIPYLTRADRFFIGSAVLVFLGLFKAVLTLAVAGGPRAHFIERADRWGKWIFPLAMAANFALAFFA
jgi:hypothetical protein